jgi:hypothetical protein
MYNMFGLFSLLRGRKSPVVTLLVLGLVATRMVLPSAVQWGYEHDREVAEQDRERPRGEAVTAHDLPVIDLSGRPVTTQATANVPPLLIAGVFGAGIVAVGFVGAAMLWRRSQDQQVSP